MGMQNSAQSFQKLVDTVLKDIPNCFKYLDDILVFNKTKEEHLRTLDTIFQRLAEAGLTINLSKCEFGKSTVDYLGFMWTQQGSGQ